MELPSLIRPRASLLIPKCVSLQVFPDRICTENLVCCFRENLFGKPCSLRRCETRFPRTLPLVRDLSIGAMRTRSLAVAQAAGEVAVLDMAEYYLAEGREESRTRFVAELREHCHDVGFFYVKNHGVSLPLCDSILSMARDFFDLPSEVKYPCFGQSVAFENQPYKVQCAAQLQIGMDYSNSAQFRGYMKLGVENTAGIPDFREQIEFGPEEDVDTGGFGDCHVYPPYRRLKGPNQWPPETCLPSFRPIVMEFMKQMGSLSMHLMQALALSLGLDQGYFDADFKCSPHYQLKVARYPPKLRTDSEGAVEVFGVGPHSDTGFLSLLLQDQVGGLQAQNVNGDWIDVPPKSGTFVVNLGEMLQLATNGYYLATVHRVLSLPGTASRYSVPFFFNPQLDAEIKSMDLVHLISTGLDNEIPSHEIESRYDLFRGEQKRVCEGERSSPGRRNGFVIKGGESTHGGKNKLHSLFGTNAFKSFARSHPEVVRRHHPDLVVDSNGLAAAENIASDSSLLQLGP